VLTSVLLTMLAGSVTGVFGALLGIGGGVFLVPFLNLALGLPMKTASGISLITVIATSTATCVMPGRLRLVNLRLGMVLEVFTTMGGLVGLLLVRRFSDATLQYLFGWVMALGAIAILTRLEVRNVIRDTSTDVGVLGGRYYDPEVGAEVAYRLKRLPVALGVSFLAGVVSMLGVGGGVVKVPALISWCGIPLRIAAATSALMIAATAVVGAISYYAHGDVVAPLAAAAVLGVLVGSRLGSALGLKSRAKHLKLLMSAVLATVALIYFLRAGQ
jgi:uncharacterized membrane protein YfcA